MNKSRWFKVTGERFDWFPKPRVMRTWHHGEIGYAPVACVELGIAAGLIEQIKKPQSHKVDKSGRVVRAG